MPVLSDHLHEKFGSLELDAIVLELEKKNGVADLKESSTEIRELYDPEILPVGAFDLASSKWIHMGSYNLHHLFVDSETCGVFGCDDRMTVGFERGEMIVMEESGERTYFQIGTKKPCELVREK